LRRLEPDQHKRPIAESAARGSVTAILPVHNSRNFVSRAIDSVISQEGPEHLLEIIVVDDHSSDRTAQFVRGEYAGDARVRVLETSRNIGPGGARNAAIAEARGEWIAPIDADDAWSPQRLARLVPQCDDNLDMLFDNLLGYDQFAAKETGPLLPCVARPVSLAMMARERSDATGFDYGYLKPLIRRSLLEQLGIGYPEVRVHEDLLFYLELLISGARARFTPEPLYVYTTPVGQISRKRSTLSATLPDDEGFALMLVGLAEKYRDRLTPADSALLRDRAEELRTHAPISRVHDNWTRRRYGEVVRQLLLDGQARRQTLEKLARRLRGSVGQQPGGD
jgi:glycosyltransferase involved in cell wall biosynthesis